MKIEYSHEITVADYNFLRKSVGWTEIEKTQAQTGINHTAFLIAAVSDSKTVGMARVISDGGYVVVIADVIVHPDYQRMGIGKGLMQNVMDYINSTLKEGQGVLVNLMAAKGKEQFYNQFGFTARPNDTLGAGMTQWIKK